MSSKLTSGVLIAAFLVAIPVSAQTLPPAAGASFCTNIDKATAQIQTRLTEVDAQVAAFGSERKVAKTERWDSQNDKLGEKRDTANTNRNAGYDKLYAKASTTEQTAAADTFKATVEAAVTTRKAAVDAAVQAYRDGIDTAIANFSTNLSTAHTTFKSSVDAAIAKAKADCAAGVDSVTVRSTLSSSIKAAQDMFKASREGLRSSKPIQTTQKELAATRKAAIDKAIADFKTTVQTASTALKAAFPKTTTP